jgi:O-methyltransferase domain
LESDTRGSLRTLALAQQDFVPVWAELEYTVRTGRPSFDHVYGEPNWAYRQRHPDANERFNGLMAQHARARADSLLRSGCLPATGTVVDVGGGNGTLLAIVLAHHPQLRGVLFDQPHVVEEAASVFADAHVADRCDTVAGDFFAEVPSGGDLYVLSGILWDWPDDRATAILRSCRNAMGSNAQLVLVDGVVIDNDQPSPITNIDVQLMLTNAGARIRTAAQWHDLLTAAGFTHPSAPRTEGVVNVLVTTPAWPRTAT